MQTTVNEILQNISSLSAEEQYFIAEILNKRLHDSRRKQIARRGKEAQKNYDAGKISSGTAADLLSSVENDD